MSKDYKDFIKPLVEKTEDFIEEPVVEGVAEAVEEIVEIIAEDPVEEVKEEPIESITVAAGLIVGKVVDCRLLAVRSKPKKKASSVAIIPVGTKVKIDMESSTLGFYAVITEHGDVGYCMKDYIAVV